VSAVPVIVAFKDGKAQERLIGLQDVDKLRDFVNKVVDQK
jgi:thioredoxin 1